MTSERVSGERDPEFEAWRDRLPATHWARYDLSACRLGWDAGRRRPIEAAEQRTQVLTDLVVRAQYAISEIYETWHSDAKSALKENSHE